MNTGDKENGGNFTSLKTSLISAHSMEWIDNAMEEENANWNSPKKFGPDVKYGWVLVGTWIRFGIDPNSLKFT